MPPLPVVAAQDCIAVLRKFGYEVARQKGSHVRLVCSGRNPVSVPVHQGQTLKRGTLRAILREADISVEDFVAVLSR